MRLTALASRQPAEVAVTRQIGEPVSGAAFTNWLRATALGSGPATLTGL